MEDISKLALEDRIPKLIPMIMKAIGMCKTETGAEYPLAFVLSEVLSVDATKPQAYIIKTPDGKLLRDPSNYDAPMIISRDCRVSSAADVVARLNTEAVRALWKQRAPLYVTVVPQPAAHKHQKSGTVLTETAAVAAAAQPMTTPKPPVKKMSALPKPQESAFRRGALHDGDGEPDAAAAAAPPALKRKHNTTASERPLCLTTAQIFNEDMWEAAPDDEGWFEEATAKHIL